MADNSHHSVHLLIGVPVNFEEYFEQVKKSDWLAKYKPDKSNKDPVSFVRESWNDEYQPYVAAPLCVLIDRAQELGVRVKMKATLCDLTTATDEGNVVILFAHLKGCGITSDDLAGILKSSALIELLKKDAGNLAMWLASQLRGPRSLEEILNEALEVNLNERDLDRTVDKILESRLSKCTRRRDEIDHLLKIRPGNRLELFDGLHDRKCIGQAISQRFTGLLDLTTCTSSVLADYLLKERHNSFRMVQFEHAQKFIWHAYCVKIAINLHIEHGMSYLDSRRSASDILQKEVQHVMNQKGGV
jgi:hypothetical protein